MKNLALLSIAFALLVLAASIAWHANAITTSADEGRYQISYVAGMTGVYRIDTVSGELSICSPASPKGCITIEQAHEQIIRQRENAMNAAKSASDSIDNFTKDRALELRGVIDKFKPKNDQDESNQPPAPSAP